MSFLAPLFLVGAAAIALPVLFHLIRRSIKERTMFSSLMFLLPSPPRLTRRSRLEHLLLLALRCAVLGLLALGFARPFIKQFFPETAASAPAKRLLVLLDTSASMQRQGLWNSARQKAEEIARQAGVADAVAFCTFDRQLRSLLTFEQWTASPAGDRLALARSRLAEAQPGWAGTALDSSLIQAAELFGDAAKTEFAGARRVIVITDFQEGSRLTALQGYAWPEGVEVILEKVEPRPGSNAGLQLMAEAAETAVTREPAVRVRVENAPDSKHEQFQAGWAGKDGTFLGKPIDLYVPAGQSRIVSLPALGSNAAPDRVILRGDDEPFDNTVFVMPPRQSEAVVLYLGTDSETEVRQPLFFLRRALQDTGRQSIKIRAEKAGSSARPNLETADVVVLTTAVNEQQTTALREAVEKGKTLLFAPTTPQAASVLGGLLGTEAVPATEKRLDSYAMLGHIDFAHPLFAPFADARFSDFTKIHFWKYRKVDAEAIAEARTVAAFDSGDPAVLEIPLGKGRVIVFTSGWHPADSQLALSSKFVPLLYALIESSGAAPPAPAQYFVGATVPLGSGSLQLAAASTVQLPDGSTARLEPGVTNFSKILQPGIYSVQTASGASRFAVNLEPAESRTAPRPIDELERVGVPGAKQAAATASTDPRKLARLQNAELESRQKLWRWLIVAALGVAGLETWLAGRTTRRTAPEEVAS